MAARPDSIYAKFAIGAAVFFFLFEAFYLATSHPPYDATQFLIGRDFVNVWMGARAVLHHTTGDLFNFARYNELLHAQFGPNLPPHNWSYPPSLLLLIWPFGLLPYLWSYLAWVVAGLGLYCWTAYRQGVKRGLWFLVLSPATIVNIVAGQNGFFAAALIVPALSNLERNPALSGILLGILAVKPQLGLLIPLVLVLTRNWRCMVFAVTTALVIAAIAGVVFGPQAWRDYIVEVLPVQSHVLQQPSGFHLLMMPTAFANLRLLHASIPVAWVAQCIVSIAAIAAVAWTYWRPRDPLLSTAMLLTCSLAVSPYVFNYDMAALTIVLAQLRNAPAMRERGTPYILAVWCLPLAMIVAGLAHISGSVLVLLAFGYFLFGRLRDADQPSAAGVSNSAAVLSIN